MKNQFFLLLFTCLFAFGNTSFTKENQSYLELGGGAEAIIYDGKTGKILVNFNLPEKYLGKEKDNSLSVKIVIAKSKNVVFLTESTDFSIVVPKYLSGDYLITIEIGGFRTERKITL